MWLLDVPAEEGTISVSIFGWDSGPCAVGWFEELGTSDSLTDELTFLAKSMDTGPCLWQLQDFSACDPSFSSSASLEDKPYNSMNK